MKIITICIYTTICFLMVGCKKKHINYQGV